MNLIEKIKRFYRKNEFTYYLCYPARILYNFLFFYIIPDKLAIERKFYKCMGYKLDWNNLRTFSEKLQWLKLYNRKPWYSDCVDKLKVREYVSKKLGTDKYLIPLYFQTSDLKDIKPENMPDEPFVIKCNHDNASYKMITDKSKVDWKELRLFYKRRLNGRNFYWGNREWPYKNVKPKIMVEAFLLPQNVSNGLLEYKFYCFGGEIRLIQLSVAKHGKKEFRYLREDYTPYDVNYFIGEMDMLEELPTLSYKEEMQQIALTLAKEFEYHIRVDIYQCNEKLYIGELTFFDGAGFDVIHPNEWNLELGSYLHLPIDKN